MARTITVSTLLDWEDVEGKQRACPILSTVRKWMQGENVGIKDPKLKPELLTWKRKMED